MRKYNLNGYVPPEDKKLMRFSQGYRHVFLQTSRDGQTWDERGRWFVVKDGAEEYIQADIIQVLQRAIADGYTLHIED